MSGAALAGPIADAALEDLRALQAALARDLMRVLVQLDTESGSGDLVRMQGQTTAAVYRQINEVLARVSNDAIDIQGRRALEAVEAVVGSPPSGLSIDVRAELDQILDRQAADVVAVFDRAGKAMREAVARGVASGGSLADVIAAVADAADLSASQASSAVDSAIMAVGRRAVMVDAAELEAMGIDLVYLYVGPRDQKNRPFCRQWVGKAVTKPAALKNDHGLAVDDYCGGYNCRHSWAPMPIDDALAGGYRIFDTSEDPGGVDITARLTESLRVA